MSPIAKNENVRKDEGRPLASLARTMDAKAFSSLVPRPSSLVFILALLLFLTACGSSTPNTTAAIDPASGQHAAGWLPGGHKAAAEQDLSVCAQCHGSDLLGGISRVSCTRCHLGGVDSTHPLDWAQEQIWSKHAAYVKGLDSARCANAACHGADLAGTAESGPSCESCHLEGAGSKHPRVWGEHAAFLHGDYALINGGAKCANAACHGPNLGGVAGSGPACTVCHAAPPHEVTVDRTSGCANCHPQEVKPTATSRLFHPFDPRTAPTASAHAAYARTAGAGSCAVAVCHGTSLTGGLNANCPSCTSCHLGGVDKVHPASFGAGTTIITEHQTYVAQNSTAGCANAACHGSNLTGGTSSAPSCTKCHVGGVITISKHPFAAPAIVNHEPFLAANLNDTSSCALAACHGTGLAGGVAGPSCSSCHLGGALSKHPASFGTTTIQVALNHNAYVNANTADGCRNSYCHGSSLTGAAPAFGPSCSTTACHQNGSPVVVTNCASCHGRPPTGTAGPNRNGAHAVHNAFPGVTNVCDTCHTGAGTGATNHFNGAVNIQLAGAYNAKRGAASRNADGTCSSVSCHGGRTTPVWLTGTINVNTQCASCHEYGVADGSPEANSFWSGRHDFHVNSSRFTCDRCHDAGKLPPNHFASLNTPAMEGPASATLLDTLNYSGGSCNVICHPGARQWAP